MDDDMKTRIARQKGAISNTENQDKIDQKKLDQDARERFRANYNAKSRAEWLRMLHLDVLGAQLKEATFDIPLLSSLAVKMATSFSISTRPIKHSDNNPVQNGERIGRVSADYMNKFDSRFGDMKTEHGYPYLVITFNDSAGIAVDCTPDDLYDYEGENYSYSVYKIGYTNRIIKPFYDYNHEGLFSGGWRITADGGYRTDNREELVEYLKNQIAEAIAQNDQKFASQLALRGVKMAAAVGLTLLFLKSCTPVFGQEADPANDFMPPQPEEPSAHLMIGDPK